MDGHSDLPWMLLSFSIVGTLGNSLVIFGFCKMLHRNLTSTVFILVMAVTDLVTSALTIPLTLYLEYVKFFTDSDILCKTYHFILTSTVPFSIFLMVLIAVDRYLCICKPFLRYITVKKALYIVGLLVVFALCLGTLTSLCYGLTLKCVNVTTTVSTNDLQALLITTPSSKLEALSGTDSILPHRYYLESSANNTTNQTCTKFLYCDKSPHLLPEAFQIVYIKLYSVLFLIAVIVVSVLYSMIYVSISRRRIRTHKTSLNSLSVLSDVNSRISNGSSVLQNNVYIESKADKSTSSKLKHKLSKKSEKLFLENFRTAAMMFTVTVVFIIVFLPSSLMALKIIRMNVVVFYMYFLHGIINPFIYAVMNENFRRVIRTMGHLN